MRSLITIILLLLAFFQIQAQETKQPSTLSLGDDESVTFAAHWLTPSLIVIAPNMSFESPVLTVPNVSSNHFPLSSIESPNWLITKFPHLAAFKSFKIDIDPALSKKLIKHPLAIMENPTLTSKSRRTYVQTANLLDVLYTSGEKDADEETELGAHIKTDHIHFKLWAPTARNINVLLFDKNKTPLTPHKIALEEDTNSGIWHAKAPINLRDKYYRYDIEIYHPVSRQVEYLVTTDPYSLSLSANSEYSQIVDLSDKSTLPEGWFSQLDNKVNQPVDNIFYETHIRDFSASDAALSSPEYRGKYLAFTETNSHGIKHLKALKKAGINSIHLLPAFDIGTVNENNQIAIDISDSLEKICQRTAVKEVCELDIDKQLSLQSYLRSLPRDSEAQQEIVSALREFDNFNWGYDPFHYSVPEGSYAVNPAGKQRIVEFREMIQHLHNLGFRVIMDVVYNHTHQAGLSPTAVLDKIVPNYYHRLDPITGKIAQSTCCDNTATERVMMEKLMIDSLLVWTEHYKIDGFRFDLMAHQPKSSMLKARKAVQNIDADNYFYGEGWNFGEVANNQRFIQASQLELAGTKIGTFTDRLRDAVRGGAFTAAGSSIRKSQGIGNGLGTIANELQNDDTIQYLDMADHLRLGLTGNLANYPLKTHEDLITLGKHINYGGQPAGYALDPADTINYVSKHDNQSLWDNNQYRIAYHLDTHERVRMQLQSLAFVLYAQGIPFIHMGSELLRSKGFLRDSYDYGDWFNAVDFSKQVNNYGIGLPPAAKDQQNWSMIKEIYARNNGKDTPSAKDISFSSDVFIDMLKVRMSSQSFRLSNAQDIINRVRFHNTGKKQVAGLIVMEIKGDGHSPETVVIFNTSAKSLPVTFKNAHRFTLHPILQKGHDDRVKQSKITTSGFIIPSLTTSVFIEK